MFHGAAMVVQSLFSFLFPPACLACEGATASLRERLCPTCRSALRRVTDSDPVYRCALFSLRHDGLVDALAVPFLFTQDGPLQRLVHCLKYQGMTVAGEILGDSLGMVITEAGAPSGSICIPVPLHRVKYRERGYNQAAVICSKAARAVGSPMRTDVLRRVVYTQTQTKLDSDGRRRNVDGAFSVTRRGKEVLNGAAIILVDDVMTTGATARACAVTMRAAGVRWIMACAAALAE